jgi:hypothetical protein
VEDGRVDVMSYVRPCYPTFTIFDVLDHRGIVVIYSFAWTYIYDPRGMRLLATSPIVILISSLELCAMNLFSF